MKTKILFAAAVFLSILVIGIIVGAVFLSMETPIGFDKVAAEQNIGISVLPVEVSDNDRVIFGGEGVLYLLNTASELYQMQEDSRVLIAQNVFSFTGTGNGIAYYSENRLYFFDGAKSIFITEDVPAYCWDGESLVYCQDDQIIQWQPNLAQTLVQDEQRESSRILANEKWLVVLDGYGAIKCYERSSAEISEMEKLETLQDQTAFLAGEWLISVGCYETGAIAVYLPTGERKNIDLGFGGGQYFPELSVAADDCAVYLSVCLKSWPKLDAEEYQGTFVLSPKTMKIQKISNTYYPCLLLGKDGLLNCGRFFIVQVAEIKQE